MAHNIVLPNCCQKISGDMFTLQVVIVSKDEPGIGLFQRLDNPAVIEMKNPLPVGLGAIGEHIV